MPGRLGVEADDAGVQHDQPTATTDVACEGGRVGATEIEREAVALGSRAGRSPCASATH